MEGIKFYGISEAKPFGIGSIESGVYMLESPGGTSFSMKDSIIGYRLVNSIMPSASPSQSSAPSLSGQPSQNLQRQWLRL